jgi:hypothetical protein
VIVIVYSPPSLNPPPGASETQWSAARAGAAKFVADGWSQRAVEAGWSESELFRVPSNWHCVDETGVAWLITNWTVVEVDTATITVRSPWSESRLKFYRVSVMPVTQKTR